MSQENVETFQRAVRAYNDGDLDGVLEAFDPEVEWHAVFQVMLGGAATVCRGQEEVRAYFQELSEDFAELRLRMDELRDLGDRLVVSVGSEDVAGPAGLRSTPRSSWWP